MNCPVCKDVKLVVSERQSVEIDYCPECRGVWLDRGELDKIIERSSQPYDPPAREAYRNKDEYRDRDDFRDRDDRRDKQHYSSDDHYHKKKKKGGFLDDIFDF